MAILTAKVAPALAGAYVRGLFSRKPLLDRLAEALGGVLLVVYGGEVAAGGLWAVLGWALRLVGIAHPTDVMARAQSDLLAAFLVGLVGMTIAEGAIVFTRAWIRAKASATGE